MKTLHNHSNTSNNVCIRHVVCHPFQNSAHTRHSSFVGTTKLLQMIQGIDTIYITRSIKGTAIDILEAHANIPSIDLLFCEAQFQAAMRISALPQHHPLHMIAHKVSTHFIKSHRSPLHYLFFTTGIKPPLCRNYHLYQMPSLLSPNNVHHHQL